MKQFTTISRGMGKVLLLCIMSTFSLYLKAQISQEACHTVIQDRTYEQMRREAAIISRVRNIVRGRGGAASTDTVPVFFTVFRNDDGSFADPLVDEALADQALDQLNQYFSPIHLYFTRLGAVNYIDNTAFTAFSKHHHLEAFSYVSTALNVYTKSGSGSFAQFPTAMGPLPNDPVSINVADRSNMLSLNSGHFLTTSFAHEMGHSYGLLHTFEGARVYNNPVAPTPGFSGNFLDHPYGDAGNIFRRELVIRSESPNRPFALPNSANAGDFVADTPAFCVSTATYPNYYPDRQRAHCGTYPFDKNECNGCIIVDCNYEGDYVDYNGDTLVNTQVSIRNLMSYTSCRAEFTPGQYERMAYYHEYVRKLQYDAGRKINCTDTVFFEDTAIPMDDIILQFSHPGQGQHCHTTTNSAGQFQAVLYDPRASVRLLKAGTALDPDYQSSPWVQASVAQIIAHSYQEADWVDGVDHQDLVLLRQHLAGTDTLNGYHQLAADLDHDGQLTEADAHLLEQLIQGDLEHLSEYTSPWQFVPAYIPQQYSSAFHLNPFQMEIEGVAYHQFAPYLEADWEYRPGDLPVGQSGFKALKLGDLNGSCLKHAEAPVVIIISPANSEPEQPLSPSGNQITKFGCFPNPIAGALTVVFKAQSAGEAELLVTNPFFSAIYQEPIALVEGLNKFSIDGHDFPSGVLVVMLKTREGVFYKKVIKNG